MDFSDLGVVEAASRGSDMPLLNPFSMEPTGVVFRVLGYDADEVVAAGRRFSSVALMRKNKANLDDFANKKLVAQAAAAVVGLAEGSEPFEFQGKVIPIPSAEFTKVLSDKNYLWIAAQVQRHGDDRGNYLPEALSD